MFRLNPRCLPDPSHKSILYLRVTLLFVFHFSAGWGGRRWFYDRRRARARAATTTKRRNPTAAVGRFKRGGKGLAPAEFSRSKNKAWFIVMSLQELRGIWPSRSLTRASLSLSDPPLPPGLFGRLGVLLSFPGSHYSRRRASCAVRFRLVRFDGDPRINSRHKPFLATTRQPPPLPARPKPHLKYAWTTSPPPPPPPPALRLHTDCVICITYVGLTAKSHRVSHLYLESFNLISFLFIFLFSSSYIYFIHFFPPLFDHLYQEYPRSSKISADEKAERVLHSGEAIFYMYIYMLFVPWIKRVGSENKGS